MKITQLIKVAETVTDYSLDIKKGEKVLIQTSTTEPKPLIMELIKKIVKKGGIPLVKISDSEINALTLEISDEKIIDVMRDIMKEDVERYDSFIYIRCINNDYTGKNIPAEMLSLLRKKTRPIVDKRVNERKWVIINYPTKLDAYKAKLPYDDYFDYAMKVMGQDYSKMAKNAKILKKLVEETNKVRITSPGTDLTFSIKDIPVLICAGESNIPGGEVFTAPVKESVEGTITYNTNSPQQGEVYSNIKFTFKKGEIIKATCEQDDKKLNEILDTDEGARYVGEFALGINPLIKEAVGDTLYDEKINGSIHFTPGSCYSDASNGNKSGVHWDIVLIQRASYGGGNIYFDDVLIRKDGKFVSEELKGLN